MELVELHVRDLGARAVRHRDAVARRDVGVRRVEVDLARRRRVARTVARARIGHDLPARLVEHVGARAHLGPAVLGERDEVDRACGPRGCARAGSRSTASSSARSTSRPVMSAAWATRRALWPPSRCRSRSASPSRRRPRRRSKRAPMSCSIAMRAGPSLTQISTARSWQRPGARRRACPRCARRTSRPRRGRRRSRPARTWCSTRRALRFVTRSDVAVRGGLEREGQPGDAAADDEVVRRDGHGPDRRHEATSAAATTRAG